MKQINSNNIKILFSDTLEELAVATVELLTKKQEEYKKIFNIDNIDEIKVNYFDDLEDFRNFIYELRGEKQSLPEYAEGTYDNGMINAYITRDEQMNRVYVASHELFHILYMKYILNDDYSKRIVWYDEGMAQYMSGEKSKYNDEEMFKKFYLKVKESTKVIPKLNLIEHGISFCNEQYNGYDLSYLSVKYLSEILSDADFKDLMSDFLEIKIIGNDIIEKMFQYYDDKYYKELLKV